MTPTIAIIIPAYNVESYIEESIGSVLNQTVPFDELIIIDDGSSDRTLEIIKSIQYPIPTRIIEQANSGQGIARNRGIESSSSKYTYFFDSDDILEANACEILKRELETNEEPDLFFFEGQSFLDQSIDNPKHLLTDYSRPFHGSFKDTTSFLIQVLRTRDLSCSPCLYVSKRSIWIRHNLRFNHLFHEDEEVLYLLIVNAKSYTVSDKVLFNRRIRSDSTMTMKKTWKHSKGIEANVVTLLMLLNGQTSIVREAIQKRLGSFCISYVLTSYRAGSKINWKLVFQSVKSSEDRLLPIRMVYSWVRLIGSDLKNRFLK